MSEVFLFVTVNMRWALCYAALEALLVASPVAGYVNEKGLDVVKTVTLPNGQVIDWVRKESQGEIASPPPSTSAGKAPKLVAQHAFNDNTRGPEGTVPILRNSGINLPKKLPPNSSKKSSRVYPRQYQGQHWYVSTSEIVDNNGGSASLSMFKAYVQSSGDFSLLQTAVIHESNGGSVPIQTLESGWINYPDQVRNPHLFTFFTTNGYSQDGDNIGGWNTDQKGWVQVDSSIYPGIELSPLSVVGGDQHEVSIRYNLHNGSWWLGVNEKWVGYYPANLYSQGGNDPSDTLETKANQINWYGEIYQSESALTTTDMGSGHFAKDGYGKAAYFHNLLYTDTNGQDQVYDGSQGTVVSDSQRYSIDAHWNTAEAWGSYFFLGGPGAGGQIGG